MEYKKHGLQLHTNTWMILTKAEDKRAHTIWVYDFKLWKQAKLIYGGRSQDGFYLDGVVTGREHEGGSGALIMLFLDLNVGYIGVISLWKSIKVAIHIMRTFCVGILYLLRENHRPKMALHVLRLMIANLDLIPHLTRNVILIRQSGIFWAVPKRYLSCGPSPFPAPHPEKE